MRKFWKFYCKNSKKYWKFIAKIWKSFYNCVKYQENLIQLYLNKIILLNLKKIKKILTILFAKIRKHIENSLRKFWKKILNCVKYQKHLIQCYFNEIILLKLKKIKKILKILLHKFEKNWKFMAKIWNNFQNFYQNFCKFYFKLYKNNFKI